MLTELGMRKFDCSGLIITKVRKNMKPVRHTPFDQAPLKRRALIWTVFDELS
jgi:hypothetical protein